MWRARSHLNSVQFAGPFHLPKITESTTTTPKTSSMALAIQTTLNPTKSRTNAARVDCEVD